MPLRWIPFSRVSMQRAGVLVAVTEAASDARATSLEGIARSYATSLRRQVPVPPNAREAVAGYLREQRLWKRYPSLRGADTLPADVTVELQDLWLADPRLPASTGAITDEVIDEPPQLAASIHLLRAGNFTRTDRGRALLATIRGIPAVEAAERGEGQNPFILSAGARALLAYSLLDADFDFVQAAYGVAQLDDDKFTRADFADQLNEACRVLRKRWTRRARTGADRRLLARLEEWARQIDKPRRSGERWGGGRPPDQLATLRLEPYVDLGLITRLSRNAYRYRLNEGQRAFFDAVANAEDADAFLTRRLFTSMLVAEGRATQRIDGDEIWTRVRAAYDTLKSALGFAAFDEVTLLAIGRLLDEGDGRYFEIADGLEAIREQQRRNPRQIRFGVKRGGRLTYMKIVEGKDR